MTKTQFAKTLKTWRSAGTQEIAAALLGRPLATYQNWEQARSMPQGRALEIILGRIQSKRLHPKGKL